MLGLGTLDVADPGPGQALVEVVAAGLNRADLLQRRGLYPAPEGAPPDVPGLEYAGRVAAIGRGVSGVEVGDEVMGIVGGGGFASLVLVHERELIRAPKGMALEEAAAIPEAFVTAYDALFAQAELAAGERVLIHAIGSGVGTAALQLASVAGAQVMGSSRTLGKLERAQEIASFEAIHVEDGSFAVAVKERGGADVVLDLVGASYLDENIRALRSKGRLVVIGLMGGASASLSLGRLLRSRLRVMGSVLRTRPLEEKAALAQRFSERVVPLFERGAIRPIVDAILPMSEVAEAHERMERNDTFGKLVLRWD